jgi:hypothetical protein
LNNTNTLVWRDVWGLLNFIPFRIILLTFHKSLVKDSPNQSEESTPPQADHLFSLRSQMMLWEEVGADRQKIGHSYTALNVTSEA